MTSPPFFQLPEEQRLLQASVRKLVDRSVAPRAAEIDASAEFPWDILDLFRQQGLLGMSVPQEFGGGGLSLFDTCLVYQEIARACLTSCVTLADQKLGSDPLITAGSEDLKRRFLPAIATGEKLIAFALTEPNAGSDVAAMRTRAVRKGDQYVLNGRKSFITHGSIAHLCSVFAVTDPAAGRRGISCFLVPRDAPGFGVGRLEKKMGLRASPTAELIFEDCCIPAENLIGNEGDGFRLAMTCMNPARIVVAFQSVGLAEGALQCARDYLLERVQFGRPLIQFQGVQFMLADMAMQVDAARFLSYAAAAAYDQKAANSTRLGAEAKTFASDTAMRVTVDAVQLLGGSGYTQDFPVERMMRDAKVLQIFDGTNQIQRLVIAKEMARTFE